MLQECYNLSLEIWSWHFFIGIGNTLTIWIPRSLNWSYCWFFSSVLRSCTISILGKSTNYHRSSRLSVRLFFTGISADFCRHRGNFFFNRCWVEKGFIKNRNGKMKLATQIFAIGFCPNFTAPAIDDLLPKKTKTQYPRSFPQFP